MIKYFKYHWKLNKLQKLEDKVRKDFDNDRKEAVKQQDKDRDEIMKINAMAAHDISEIVEEKNLLITARLRHIAQKLILPLPDYTNDKMWEDCSYEQNRKFLTEKGIMEIRSLIRREKLERIELIMRWATILIGLIGAATGLFAIILK